MARKAKGKKETKKCAVIINMDAVDTSNSPIRIFVLQFLVRLLKDIPSSNDGTLLNSMVNLIFLLGRSTSISSFEQKTWKQ
jgi:hypothetical protein